jgi:hypothetical protein
MDSAEFKLMEKAPYPGDDCGWGFAGDLGIARTGGKSWCRRFALRVIASC